MSEEVKEVKEKKKTSAKHWTKSAGKVRGLVSNMYTRAFIRAHANERE